MQRAAHLLALALASAGTLGSAGCSWTFDEDAPLLPLVGNAPSLGSLQKLNNGPVYSSAIVRGADNAFWLSLQEDDQQLRVVRLSEPAQEMTVEGDQFLVTWRTFFTWTFGDEPADPSMPRPATLSMTSAGAVGPPEQLEFPLGVGTLVVGGLDDLFAYSAPDPMKSENTFSLYQRGVGLLRTVPLISAENRGLSGSWFSSDRKLFYERASCGTRCPPRDPGSNIPAPIHIVAHSTTEERDIDVGLVPQQFIYYEAGAAGKQLITCGTDGVRAVPIEPSEKYPARTLDDLPCSADYFALQRVKLDDGKSRIELYYSVGTELRSVPIEGTDPPRRVLDRAVERVLAVYDEGLIVYSQDPGDRYIYGVGDGWIGDWRFMNRGRGVDVNKEKQRVHFLENAAQGGGIGDLCSAPFGGAVATLARNVYQYDELADGRVLASSNHAFRGTQNRVILIDEAKGEARWVADQATRYSFIPGSNDLLVDIVTGASSSDLVRVPIPPADTP